MAAFRFSTGADATALALPYISNNTFNIPD